MRRLLILIFLFPLAVTAQDVYLSGYTRDSTSFDLLPYVSIHSTKGALLSSSNDNGYFSMTVKQGDTVVFTRLGYKPVKFSAASTSWDLNILMPETVRVLEGVVIYDHYIIHGHNEIQKSLKETATQEASPYKNPTQNPSTNMNLVQTFGPGMVINGALSRLLGVDKEKKKLSAGKAEYVKTSVYNEVIISDQVKDYLRKLYNISEEVYYQKLEAFKVRYPTAVYIMSREDIIKLMVSSFAMK